MFSEEPIGIGTINNAKDIKDGDDVSLNLAAWWVFETMAKSYAGKVNQNPWRIVPTGITQIDGVDAYLFDVGQGKHQLDELRFKAAVSQNRKIYKLDGDKPELSGTIPDDAPEPSSHPKLGSNSRGGLQF